jgi:hypothetical protein
MLVGMNVMKVNWMDIWKCGNETPLHNQYVQIKMFKMGLLLG